MNDELAKILRQIANWHGKSTVVSKSDIVGIEFTGTDGKWYSFEYHEIWTAWGDDERECESAGWTIYQDGIRIKEIQDRAILYWLGACAGTAPSDIKITTYKQKPSVVETGW